MALMDWLVPQIRFRLDGTGVRLRPAERGDFAAWSQLRSLSKDHLQPFEPTWPDDDLTRSAFRRRLAIYEQEMEKGTAYPLLIFRSSDLALVGGITLSQIRRGVAQTGTLGYWIGQPFTGRGFASAAVAATMTFAFERLALHRVEAACLPDNLRSQRVLEKQRFVREGLASSYLKINGIWRDHLLYGRVAP
jgi:ribosomal-protein-alanine N-acetyltransferase